MTHLNVFCQSAIAADLQIVWVAANSKDIHMRALLNQLHSGSSGPASSWSKNSLPGSVGMKVEGIHISGP